MPGKRRNQIWDHFRRDSAKTTNIKAICKYCEEIIQAIPSRMEKNFGACNKAPADSDVEMISDEEGKSY